MPRRGRDVSIQYSLRTFPDPLRAREMPRASGRWRSPLLLSFPAEDSLSCWSSSSAGMSLCSVLADRLSPRTCPRTDGRRCCMTTGITSRLDVQQHRSKTSKDSKETAAWRKKWETDRR